MRKKRARYSEDMPHRIYSFFHSYSDVGAPSFSKFARSIGATLAELESWRSHRIFDEAYRECNEIRRDYLIDNALAKRFDSSFTKFLLTGEYGMGSDDDEDRLLEVKLEVIE